MKTILREPRFPDKYYDCPKFNKLSMNSNTDLPLLNFNIRSIGANFDTFSCLTNLLNKKFDIFTFSESWLNDNNKNLYTIEGYDAFHNVRCAVAEVEIYLHIFQMFSNPK